jgi:nitrogen PTS system EIIA component
VSGHLEAPEKRMTLKAILASDGVVPSLRISNARQLLEAIAETGSNVTGLPGRVIFDALLQRERLGSTGVGDGIAIPHGKFVGLDKLVGLFFRLEKPIDFEALDGNPVDLVFVLLAPEGAGADHLKGLSMIARQIRMPGTAQKLRNLDQADALLALLTNDEKSASRAA